MVHQGQLSKSDVAHASSSTHARDKRHWKCSNPLEKNHNYNDVNFKSFAQESSLRTVNYQSFQILKNLVILIRKILFFLLLTMSQSSLTMEECHRKRGEQLCVWFPFFESIQSPGPGPDYCLVKRLMRSLHIFLTGDLARRTRLNVFAWCQLGILGTSWQSFIGEMGRLSDDVGARTLLGPPLVFSNSQLFGEEAKF